jgi:surface antigen
MKEVLIAEEGSVIKVYELQHLNKRGEMYLKKKKGDSIKTYTFKDCTECVTFPHCTGANMTEG